MSGFKFTKQLLHSFAIFKHLKKCTERTTGKVLHLTQDSLQHIQCKLENKGLQESKHFHIGSLDVRML